MEAAAKLLAASLDANFGLCHPSVPQQMAKLKARCGLRSGLSFLPWLQCCVSLHKTVLFPPQTHTGALQCRVTALWGTKEFSLALKILVRPLAGGGLSN